MCADIVHVYWPEYSEFPLVALNMGCKSPVIVPETPLFVLLAFTSDYFDAQDDHDA
jgi:hypothetical protein